MKILGGKFKGRNFYMLKGTRPTQNLTRKALFDIIGHDLSDVEFLDLFAGSGSVGLEAVSRGAKKVTFVEKNIKCVDIIYENLSLLGLKGKKPTLDAIEVLEGDAFVAIKQLSRLRKKFDVIFMDPPYNLGLAKKTLKTLDAYDILHPHCLLVVEHGKRELLPEKTESFSLIKQRKYGKSYLTIYKVTS